MPISPPPLSSLTVTELLESAASEAADGRALTFPGEGTLSFAELAGAVAAGRGFLADHGVTAGDVVVLTMQNSTSYAVAWLAVITSGAVAVPMNKRLGSRDAAFVLEHSGARFAVVDETTDGLVAAAVDEASLHSVTVIRIDGLRTGGAPPSPAYAGLHPGRTANIQYTSGTTGMPKGCLLSHAYWVRMAFATAETLALTGQDVLMTAQPQSYIDPQWNVLAALVARCELVVLDGFHPSTFMADVSRHRTTVFYCLGVMPTLLLKQPPATVDRDHALRAVFCSAIPVERHREIEERFGAPWFEVFGMTESGVNTVVRPADHDELLGSGCIGVALEHCEAAISDPEGNLLGPGEQGELVLRGLGLMSGYYQDPDATAEFFRNGWAHTGDLARMDRLGRIFYLGRLKEIIRRAGENIAPTEIEDALCSHPDVLECAVVPVPDPDVEEEIKAFVVLTPGVEVAEEDLIGFLHGRLAVFKIPRYLEFRSSLPRTPSERVAKHLLLAGSPATDD